MNVTMNLSIHADGVEEIEKLATLAGRLEDALQGLTGEVTVAGNKPSNVGGVTAAEAAAAAARASQAGAEAATAPEMPDTPEQEEVRLCERKTYFHRESTGEVFICEKGDTYPEEEGIVAVSKKTYEELLEANDDGAGSGDNADDSADDSAEVTFDDVKQAVMAYTEAKGPMKGKELVASFGVSKLSELEPDSYLDVIAKARVEH